MESFFIKNKRRKNMASEKILNAKREVVNEIADKIKNSESVVLFSYQGLTVADMAELRSKLKEANGEVKIYKNTLVRRATDKMNLDMANVLEGPNAIIFGKELLEPIKVLSKSSAVTNSPPIRVNSLAAFT